MAFGLRRKARNGAVEIGRERIDGGAQIEHERGVDDVLAGGAPVDVARRLLVDLVDLRGQSLDQRDRDVAGIDRGLAEGGEVIVVGPARRPDGPRGVARDDSDQAFRPRQRCLNLEHALEALAIGEQRPHGGAGEQGTEEGRAERVEHGAASLNPRTAGRQSKSRAKCALLFAARGSKSQATGVGQETTAWRW